jgi:hypothetical protein
MPRALAIFKPTSNHELVFIELVFIELVFIVGSSFLIL